MKTKSIVLRPLVCGWIIGALGIAPAVSGGALAALLGYYEPLLFAAAHPIHALKTNRKTLLPLCVGIVSGVLVFGRVLVWLFEAFPAEMRCAVAGALLGALPSYVKTAAGDARPTAKDGILAVGTLVCGLWLFYGGSLPTVGDSLSFSEWMLCGGVYAAGTVVVGISASCILLSMGAYEAVLSAVTEVQPAALLPLGLGFGLTAVVLVCTVNSLYTKHKRSTQFAVLGFLVSSIFPVIPPLKPDKTGVVAVLLGSAFLTGSWFLNEKMGEKQNAFTA